MKNLVQFSIPYKGLKNGLHNYDFTLDHRFFELMENHDFVGSLFNVKVDLDKKHDHCMLTFMIEGSLSTNCDRCTANIAMPIDQKYTLLLKFSESENPMEDDEIVFLDPETSILDIAPYIYEYVILSIPLVKIFDCDEDKDCDNEVLNKLYKEDDDTSEEGGIWDSLKGLNLE